MEGDLGHAFKLAGLRSGKSASKSLAELPMSICAKLWLTLSSVVGSDGQGGKEAKKPRKPQGAKEAKKRAVQSQQKAGRTCKTAHTDYFSKISLRVQVHPLWMASHLFAPFAPCQLRGLPCKFKGGRMVSQDLSFASSMELSTEM